MSSALEAIDDAVVEASSGDYLMIYNDAGRVGLEIRRAAYERTGFTGDVTLSLSKGTSADLAFRFANLGCFAEYCGTVGQTSLGFGATILDNGAVAGTR